MTDERKPMKTNHGDQPGDSQAKNAADRVVVPNQQSGLTHENAGTSNATAGSPIQMDYPLGVGTPSKLTEVRQVTTARGA